jgi:hypothetical protein
MGGGQRKPIFCGKNRDSNFRILRIFKSLRFQYNQCVENEWMSFFRGVLKLHQHSLSEKALQPPIPQFSHDPHFIAFRSWTTILSLEGILPEENPADSLVLFMGESADACGTERIPVRQPVCLRNPTRFAHLNVTIVCARSGRKVFFVPELPAGRFLHLEFLQEGMYALYYSPAFSQVTLHRSLQIVAPKASNSPIAPNFHPQLKPNRWG